MCSSFALIGKISKSNKELLVVELKRDKSSDVALGQIQRYMGYVLEELIEEGQTVKGIIVGKEKDLKIKRALAVTNNIFFLIMILVFD